MDNPYCSCKLTRVRLTCASVNPCEPNELCVSAESVAAGGVSDPAAIPLSLVLEHLADPTDCVAAGGEMQSVTNGGCGEVGLTTCSMDTFVGVQCEDNDECRRNNGGCGDQEFYLCNNLYNARPTTDNGGCVDINECDTRNGGCGDEQYWTCNNQDGAAPTTDNGGCVDINECDDVNGGCGDDQQHECTNVVGGDPTCQVSHGLQL